MDYTRLQQIKSKLRSELTEKRYEHTLSTVIKSLELASGTSADKDVVFLAALLHDCAKYRRVEEQDKEALSDFLSFEQIVHAPHGALIAEREYGITDPRVLDAIRYHTTGRRGMSIEEMIVCLADAIEDNRCYPNVDRVREQAKISIRAGLIASLEGVIEYEKNNIHHLTLEALEDLKNMEEV